MPKHEKHFAKRNYNQNIKESPYWTKEPRWWSPERLDELLVPVVCIHCNIIILYEVEIKLKDITRQPKITILLGLIVSDESIIRFI